MEYKHYPLPMHSHAVMAAEAAECAGDQGKFWEYVELAFAGQKSFSEDFFKKGAENLELDTDQFNQCLDSHDKKAKVLAHGKEARNLKAPGTPTLFVNGQMIRYDQNFEEYVLNLAN